MVRSHRHDVERPLRPGDLRAASALVAQVSQELLDGGRRLCFLYTDLANPTSNAIYRRIGYEHVCDSAEIDFAR